MSPHPRRVAAVDIGTVTTRLLIADVSTEGVVEVGRHTDITHLGEGLTSTGRLSEAAMARVEAVVERYAAELRRYEVEAVRTVATSASRDAANSGEFLSMLRRHGIDPEIIPGRTEARLAFAGAAFGRGEAELLVNDIGGGSTELIFGRVEGPDPDGSVRVERAASVDVGARRVSELHLISDPPSAGEIASAREWIAERLEPVVAPLRGRADVTISLAGTATTFSAVDQGLPVYDPSRVHDSVLSIDRIRELTGMLAAMPLAERGRVAGLHPGRAPVIVAGGLILGALLEFAGSDSTVVSEHDILYGIVLGLAESADPDPEAG